MTRSSYQIAQNATKSQIERAMQGHVLANAELIGISKGWPVAFSIGRVRSRVQPVDAANVPLALMLCADRVLSCLH